jgi:transposase-like protein
MKESLQEVLEAELTEVVGAAPGQCTAERTGYRAGYYSRSLVTRIGKLELRDAPHGMQPVPLMRPRRYGLTHGLRAARCFPDRPDP